MIKCWSAWLGESVSSKIVLKRMLIFIFQRIFCYLFRRFDLAGIWSVKISMCKNVSTNLRDSWIFRPFLAFLQSHYTWTKKFTERISIDNFIFGIKSEYNGKGGSPHCKQYFITFLFLIHCWCWPSKNPKFKWQFQCTGEKRVFQCV